MALCGAKQHGPGMAGVADREAAARLKERGHDGSREGARARQHGELLIEQANEFSLIEPIHKTPHERAKIGGRGGDRLAVARNVGQQQTADAAGGAAGGIVNIAAGMCLAVWLAINPSVEAAEFHAARRELASTPDFHALHVLRRLVGHRFHSMRSMLKARMSKDNSNGFTRRDLATLAAAAIAIAPKNAPAQTAPTGNPGPELDIADWSYHWYGVEHALLARGTMCNGMQMYVEHWIPREVRHPYPVVLIHGGYGQGSDWISTPDGRRGWAMLLLEQGYKVYVLDRPGQGRNPYHPWVHGYFDKEAPTFERVAKNMGAGANDPDVAQIVASMGQPMGNNPITQSVWRSRGAKLLDEIGPAILITNGDGAAFARVANEERPNLVKALVATAPTGLGDTAGVPILTVKDSKDLAPVLAWLHANIKTPAQATPASDPKPNRESTGLKLADQGCFWVGVQRKQMSYGTIAMGQMYVQYMIPAEKRYPYPVIMVHGGGGQGCHMMGIGGRPGWVHYFVQAGYSVYWLDRPSYGRSPYHPDALGPSHLPNVPPYEPLVQTPVVFNTAQWPGPGGMNDPLIDQFMANESGNVMDEAFHSDLVWRGGVELVDRIGPCILLTHAFRRIFRLGRGGSAAEPGEGDFLHGNQRQSIRRATAMGINCEPHDLRSASDGSIAIPVSGSSAAARFAASDYPVL